MTHPVSPQVRLANEIAVQFHRKPVDEAASAIANHIKLFWDPRMTRELLQRVRTDPGSLDPLVIAAAPHLAP